MEPLTADDNPHTALSIQVRIAGPVFLGGEDLEILCGAFGHTSPRKAACNNLSCSKVRPVSRPWVECLTLPFSRKEERMRPIGLPWWLNFEMNGKGCAFNGH